MGWVLNETDYICCFALLCTCQYNKLIELGLYNTREYTCPPSHLDYKLLLN